MPRRSERRNHSLSAKENTAPEDCSNRKRHRGQDDGAPVMIGQTNAERSKIRKRQRQLHREIFHSKNEIADASKTAFDEFSDRNNVLFKDVRYIREASHDLDNRVAISEIAIDQALKQNGAAFRLSAEKLIDRLRERALNEAGVFDWLKLGIQVGKCFHSITPISCLLGPLSRPQAEKKERARAQRRQRYQGEATQPENVEKTGDDTEQTEKTTKRIRYLKKVMKKVSKAERERQNLSDRPDEHGQVEAASLDLFSLICNPASFTQTVENFMDFSFLIKEGTASLEVQNGLPTTQMCQQRSVPVGEQGTRAGDASNHNTQVVIALSKDFLQDVMDAREQNARICQVGTRKEGVGTDYHDGLKDNVA